MTADVGEAFGGLGDVDEVADGFEGIVDLVSDGGGEASGGGELFGLAEDFLGLALGGGVAEDHDDADDFAAAIADGSGAVFDGNVGAVGVLEDGVVGEADDKPCSMTFLTGLSTGLRVVSLKMGKTSSMNLPRARERGVPISFSAMELRKVTWPLPSVAMTASPRLVRVERNHSSRSSSWRA